MNQDVKTLISKNRFDLADLRVVFKELRGENGCPWDRVQTHESIRGDLIEETYEVVEAIDTADMKLMREELGDLLLQVVFHAGIEEEKGTFTLDDVISDITEKLIRRHPHVFADVEADDPESALDAWEAAKGVEKTERKTVVDSMNAVPPSLPALMRAQKIIKKAAKDGYDVDSAIVSGADDLKFVAENMASVSSSREELLSSKIGDAAFALSLVAQKNGIDLEELLNKKTGNFIENYPKK